MAIARVIVGSFAVHAALLGVFELFVDGTPRPRGPIETAPRVELSEPIEVVMVPPIEVAAVAIDVADPVAQPTAPIASPAAAIVPAPKPVSPAKGPVPFPKGPVPIAAVGTGTASGTELPGGAEPGGPTSSGSRWTRMRGPDLVLHEDVTPEPGARPPAVEKKLQQNGSSYVVPDLVTTMHVAPDGRASFVDKPDIDVHVNLPSLPSGKEIGDHLAAWYRDPYAQKHARRVQDMAPHEQAVPGGWDAGAGGDANIDGSIRGPERLPTPPAGTVISIGGKLDITAWLMRKFKVGDPYSSRKRVLLDGTHEERAQIRKRYTREQLARSAETMHRNVTRAFREITDPVELRASLFALWDECTEGEGAEGQAGERARAMVIGAIRGRLNGTERAYTVEEVAALDAHRTSVQHFTP